MVAQATTYPRVYAEQTTTGKVLYPAKLRRLNRLRTKGYAEGLRIGLLSDTHGFLDPAIFSYFHDCDEIWHAGDFGPVEILDELKAFKPVRGVWGNIDGPEVRASVPREESWDCAGMRVYMTHIAGYPGAWDKRAKAKIASLHPELVICGHSHILKVMRDLPLGLIHLNPGAAGHQGWHKLRTALRFRIEAGKLFNLEVIQLGTRGRTPSPAPST